VGLAQIHQRAAIAAVLAAAMPAGVTPITQQVIMMEPLIAASRTQWIDYAKMSSMVSYSFR